MPPILESLVYRKKRPPISKEWIVIGVFITFVGTLIMILLDSFIFIPSMANSQLPQMSWWQGILSMFYGGVTEELMVRLFGMPLIVWILDRITRKEKANIPPTFYYIAIFIATILFGMGHLPTAAQVFGELSAIIVIRVLVLNSFLGLWFGYLYWRKGLEYAIIAHMSADFFLHVLFTPIFY